MIKKVKLTFPPLQWDFLKYSPGNDGVFGNYKFILNNDELDEYDYWIVAQNLNHSTEQAIVNKNNVIFDTSESFDIVNYPSAFLGQFAFVSSFRDDILHSNRIISIPVIPWFLKQRYDELDIDMPINKSKKISLLASNKTISLNHIKRFEFVKKVAKYFKDDVDIFGAGFTPFIYDKGPTLLPYQYSIILETITNENYFSEKIGDSYLAETFPLYYGCSNLEDYFSSKSFIRLDISDFEKSKKVISKILDDNGGHYADHLRYIKEAKHNYLEKYSILPALCRILDGLPNNKIDNKEIVQLKKFTPPRNFFYYRKKILNRLYSHYYK